MKFDKNWWGINIDEVIFNQGFQTENNLKSHAH